MLNENIFISSCRFVQEEVEQQLNIKVTESFVNQQMHELGLKYKKIKHISYQGNSE